MTPHSYQPPEFNEEYGKVKFSTPQAMLLSEGAKNVATAGGPEMPGANAAAGSAAAHLLEALDTSQREILKRYADGHLSILEFTGLAPLAHDLAPPSLPSLSSLEHSPECLYIASRSQILLHLVQNRAFALDLENQGKLIRFVGDFHSKKLPSLSHRVAVNPDPNSHTGLSLDPHTEAPYHCVLRAVEGHSPAPSTLILSARWNPLNEPTTIIPMQSVIDRIGARAALALTSSSFDFTRSGSSTAANDPGGSNVPILHFDAQGGFALSFNSYRHCPNEKASPAARNALAKLKEELLASAPYKISLTPSNTLLINNYRTVHCREEIKDDRRLLIRLFGYSKFVAPVILNEDPLIAKS